MKRTMSFLAGVLLLVVPLMLAGQEADAQGPMKRMADMDHGVVLEFETMVGVDAPFLNPAQLRGITGGGLPWVLEEAEGELKTSGLLKVEVEGLIVPESSGFGFNPAPFFRAAVSCITLDGVGNETVVNVFTQNGAEVMKGDPEDGDAKIVEKLMLPDPCIAPVIFVTSPSEMWFSVTGN